MPRSDSSLADREPCPWRIVDDIGGAFSMGAIGGGIFHTIKGSWNAPKGARAYGALSAMSARGPVLGGQFAVWGGVFACCDCSLTAIRQKVSLLFGIHAFSPNSFCSIHVIDFFRCLFPVISGGSMEFYSLWSCHRRNTCCTRRTQTDGHCCRLWRLYSCSH